VIGVIVADSEPAARRGAKAVKVDYEDLPAVISIDDAIAAESYYEQYGNSLSTGDLEAGFAGAYVPHMPLILIVRRIMV
jgi:xanthine dehydrogenase/oxidase